MLVLSLLLVVNIVCTEAHIKVSQYPRSTNRKVGESAIFYCGVGIFEENPGVDVYWWRVGDNEFLQSVPDQRKRFSPMERGQATFQLLNISVADRGLYYCGVKKELGPLLNGTGSTLIVHVSPTPLRIEYNETENNGSAAFIFVCTTAEFYPEQINITWYKNGLMIETGIKTTVQLNANGLHVASSSLEEVSPVKSGTTYTCQASHLTVQTATDFRFIAARRTNIGGPKGRKWIVVYRSAGGGFLILSFITITWVISRRKFAGKRESTKQPPPAEDQTKQLGSKKMQRMLFWNCRIQRRQDSLNVKTNVRNMNSCI
ncbi:tyrosine-protein phosphatase non-receptor type substrate 1-like [Pristis pectinata]|uniref:tyrosine-protein phosphatase non-receptor type substrate 1-like n=1 Tax=Pristis pectinata TaxID=685728 RepID=UPI00223C9E3C|nr:tyrosine-protein phosphatase non-receptor type substrate 1-like [Pristis pectinata]